MKQTEQNRRFWQAMIGILVLIVGFSILGSSTGVLPLLLVSMGIFMLWNQGRKNRQSGTDAYQTSYEEPPVELEQAPTRGASGADQVYTHAVDAVRNAGRDPGATHVLPVDIGIMAFRAGDEPAIYRTQPIYDDVDYVQPFVQLRLPIRAKGRIRFEIVDSDGQILFVHEDYHQLERGRNLVTPAARLPIHDAQAMHRNWELRVSADNVLLASHLFGWGERTEKVVRRHMREDGEITNELKAAIIDSQPGNMSLDELLAFQSEEAQQQARRG